MLVLDSVPPRLPLRATSSVCGTYVEFFIAPGNFLYGIRSMARTGDEKRHLGKTTRWKKKYENEIVEEKRKGPQVVMFRADVAVLIPKNLEYQICHVNRTDYGQVANTISDKKCPFTGLVSIRGRILTGRVVSNKMHRTIVIRREYLHYVPKYNRYEKRHKNLAAHVSPAFRVEEGDWVTVGQCRPLSKTVCGIPRSPIRSDDNRWSCVAIRLEEISWVNQYNAVELQANWNFFTGPLQHPPCPAPYR